MRKLLKLVLGVAVALYFVDRLARTAIERGATYALGVDTTLGAADVGVMNGTFSMGDLEVANPEGYDTPHFLQLGHGAVAVTLPSLREQTVELPPLRLSSIDVNLEKKEGKANYRAILDSLKRFEKGDAPPEEAPADGKRFVIRELLIEDVGVSVALLPIGGDLTRTKVRIDEIRLQDVGSDTDRGVLLAELADVVVKAILGAVVESGVDLPGDLAQELSGALASLEGLGDLGVEGVERVMQDVTGAAEELTGAAEEIGSKAEELGSGLEDAAKGLGGLLGGGSDDEE